jgi:NADH dehydrogenase FAD-containing subunit
MCARLLLLGGGHANLSVMERIPEIVSRGHQVTCVSCSPFHYYSGMAPGMLGGTYAPEQVRFPIQQIVERAGGTFIVGRAVRIDAAGRSVVLEDGREERYDVLSVNTGSVVAPTVLDARPAASKVPSLEGPAVFSAKPVTELETAGRFLSRTTTGGATAVVIGGGPAAVEIAGNLARLLRTAADAGGSVLLLPGPQFLRGFSRRAARLAAQALRDAGVTIGDSVRAQSIDRGGVVADGRFLPADLVILATGVAAPDLFRTSGLPLGEDDTLVVNQYLQVPGHPEIFGAGDCIWFSPRPLRRAGVYAVRQAPVLVHNVRSALERGTGPPLRPFRPQRNYLVLVNLGDGTALLSRRFLGLPIVTRSRLAFALKDRIDRRFMQRFLPDPPPERG